MTNNFKKTIIIAGWYGTGKTEFCVNLALFLAKNNDEKIYLSDLDVINPYFRSREKAEFLKNLNIEIIGNNLNSTLNQDLPAIDNRATNCILRGEQLIVDLAGSLNGLKPLSIFKRHLKVDDYDFFVVLNAFRCDVSTEEQMIQFVRETELRSGLKVTGLVNNSHLLHLTTTENILESQILIESVSKKTGVPVRLTFLKSDIFKQLKGDINSSVLTFDKQIMREDWQ
ncbi:MAG: ATP-binding protein [Firmicutes bacterium]|nr:ATP-binding protein [Bacillota bacterium]